MFKYIREYPVINPQTKINKVHILIYYFLGEKFSMNGKNIKRGYYFSMRPIEHHNKMDIYEMFSGQSICILEVNRQTPKRYQQAKSMIEECIKNYLPSFLAKNDLKIDFDKYTEQEIEY